MSSLPPQNPYNSTSNASSGASGEVPDNLIWAILVTIFCCMPFGIPSIIAAARVAPMLAAGDVAGAREASEKAKKWALWGVGGWLVVITLYAIFIFMMGGLAAMQSRTGG